MGDENPICTLGDYSKPSHKGYRNNIELPIGNNGVPLQSDTIRLMQNGCSFHKLRSENPNQHLKDFLKLVDSLDLDGANRERTCLHPRDFAKPVKAISLPQDVPSASDHHLIKLKNLVQRLMEAHIAPMQPIQVNDITSLSKRFISNQGPRCFNDAANTWMDKPNFNWERTQTFTNPQNESISVHSSSYQIKLEKALLDFDSNQEKRLSHLRTQLEQQQDDMIGKINLLWKTVSEKLNDASPPENAGNSMAPKSIAAISHDEKEELRKKGIKSPSKLLSPKYLSPASIKELNKNPSSPKRVHFVNSIVILSTDSDTEEEDDSSTNACDLNLGGMVKGKEEVKEKGKEEDEMETDMEVEEVIEEEESEFETDEEVEEIFEEEEEDEDDENFNSFPTMKELSHHEWLLKNPRPPWVKAKVIFDEKKLGSFLGKFHWNDLMTI
ncbi:hypothetical protein Tco_0788504 [Tanacetum coccineum]